MHQLSEAKEAYEAGLVVDPGSAACKEGLEMIKQAKRSPPPGSSSRAANPFGNFLNSGLVGKVVQRFKSGGRMQMYMVMMACYLMFTTWKAGNKPAKTQTEPSQQHEEAEVEDEGDGNPHLFEGPATRSFTDVSGTWLSHMQAGHTSEPIMVLLHGTSSSAEADFSRLLSRSEKKPSPISGIRLLAPDRPCHGFSPCPADGEPEDANKWLQGFLKKSKAAKIQVLAVGREAAGIALRLAAVRQSVEKIWLLDPHVAGPTPENIATGADATAWLNEQQAATVGAAADGARWLSSAGLSSRPRVESWSESKGPKQGKVSVFYGKGAAEDDDLRSALERQGLDVTIRKGGTQEESLDLFIEEIRADEHSRDDNDDGETDAAHDGGGAHYANVEEL